jgi:hypothetical protein
LENEIKKKKSSRPGRSIKGEKLFQELAALTGLSYQTLEKELETILKKKNFDLNNLTLSQLRMVVASYLRQIMGGLLEKDSTHH